MDHRHQEFLGHPEFSGDPEMSREAGISLLMHQDKGCKNFAESNVVAIKLQLCMDLLASMSAIFQI